jgi:transcriptional regulator with XRE-family HTH domain
VDREKGTDVYGLNPLRRARQARGLTLQDVAERTKLSPRMLAKIEKSEFGALPPGIQGRAHIRAYARAVGLDPDEVVRGLADRLPADPDTVGALRARERERFADDHPVAAALRDRAEGLQRTAVDLARSGPSPAPKLGPGPYALAGAIDAAIVALFVGVMLVGATATTGTDVGSVWRDAPGPFVLSCGLMAGVYFTASRWLGGRTPGAVIARRLSRSRASHDPAMLPGSFNGSPR